MSKISKRAVIEYSIIIVIIIFTSSAIFFRSASVELIVDSFFDDIKHRSIVTLVYSGIIGLVSIALIAITFRFIKPKK